MHGDPNEPADRLAQLKRYAATHNPQVSSRTQPDRLKPIKGRHVSIPGGRTDGGGEEMDKLFVGTAADDGAKDKTSMGHGILWKEKGSLEWMGPRRMAAAGIVKMYINKGELVGTMENPLYTNLSDGRGHSDSLTDADSLMVQPLLKKKVSQPERPVKTLGIELPSIAFAQSPGGGNLLSTRTLPEKRHVNTEELDFTLGNSTSRGLGQDRPVDSRVS